MTSANLRTMGRFGGVFSRYTEKEKKKESAIELLNKIGLSHEIYKRVDDLLDELYEGKENELAE